LRAQWVRTTVVVLALPLATLGAQVQELQPGTRVRVRAPSVLAGQVTGVVIARAGDSITVSRPEATPLAMPLSALTSLEISRGKSRSRGAGTGALWGGGIMLVLGIIPFADLPCKDEQSGPDCERISQVENAAFSAVGGVMIGAAIGTAIGAERWVRATLPVHASLMTQPSTRGARIGLQLARTSVLRHRITARNAPG